jgi:flagellar biosynthesis activator protein FlaF
MNYASKAYAKAAKAPASPNKPVGDDEDRREMHHAANAYAKVVKETAPPRELEATLLLKAAAKLQAVYDSWKDKPIDLKNAVLYNRRLWTVFIDAVNRDDNKLPAETRNNLLRLGVYIMAETYSLMTSPKPDHLQNIIKINRGIATGLRDRAYTSPR